VLITIDDLIADWVARASVSCTLAAMIHPGPHLHGQASALHPTAGFDPVLWLALALALAAALVHGALRLLRDQP
jgi:hypothetical protein